MPDVGDNEILQATFRNRMGVLTDPDIVTGDILVPGDATPNPLNFVKKSTGVWEASYLITVEGEHWWRVEATGAVTAAEEHSFIVNKRMVP
jgi:hypothetical protein